MEDSVQLSKVLEKRQVTDAGSVSSKCIAMGTEDIHERVSRSVKEKKRIRDHFAVGSHQPQIGARGVKC